MKLFWYAVLFSLFISSCGENNNVPTPFNSGNAAFQEHLNGVWEGSITGERPHFDGKPILTIRFAQMDTILSGEFSTSDSAFVATQIKKGVATDTTVYFEAVQTNIYDGARVKFMGRLDGNDITDTWESWRFAQRTMVRVKIRNELPWQI